MLSREYYDRCKVALQPSRQNLARHVHQYEFIPYSYGGSALTIAALKAQLKEIEDPHSQIKVTDARHREILQQRKNHPLAKAIREFAELKFQIRCFINKTMLGDDLISKYLNEISRRTNIRDLSQYSYEEVVDRLHGKQRMIPDRSIFVWGSFNGWQPIFGP